MKLAVTIANSVAQAMEEEYRAGQKAVTESMNVAGTGLKDDWRRQVASAGLGQRLGRTIRSRTFPQGTASMNAAAWVWSNAPKILDAFERGALIRAQNVTYLAIPTPEAGTKGTNRQRITPTGWENRTGIKLRLVLRPGKPGLLVADGVRINKRGRAVLSRAKTRRDGIRTGVATVPIFIMIRQVQLRKRLDLASAADRWASRVPAMITENWRDS